MIKCSKCHHIGLPKSKTKIGRKIIMLSLMVLVYPVSFVVFLFFGSIFRINGCYGTPNDVCLAATMVLSAVVTLMYIIIVLYKCTRKIEVCEKCGNETEKCVWK
jgi:uncharacterized membrane protein